MRRTNSTHGLAALTLALTLTLTACSQGGNILDQPGVTAPPGSSLTSAASNPESGDATLTATATLAIDANGAGFDKLTLSQTTGETIHEITVTWDTTTHAIQGVSHDWGPGQTHGGPTSGFTACFQGTNDCDPSKVTLDFTGQSVTLSGQALLDVFGGDSTSTLTGTVIW